MYYQSVSGNPEAYYTDVSPSYCLLNITYVPFRTMI